MSQGETPGLSVGDKHGKSVWSLLYLGFDWSLMAHYLGRITEDIGAATKSMLLVLSPAFTIRLLGDHAAVMEAQITEMKRMHPLPSGGL